MKSTFWALERLPKIADRDDYVLHCVSKETGETLVRTTFSISDLNKVFEELTYEIKKLRILEAMNLIERQFRLWHPTAMYYQWLLDEAQTKPIAQAKTEWWNQTFYGSNEFDPQHTKYFQNLSGSMRSVGQKARKLQEGSGSILHGSNLN